MVQCSAYHTSTSLLFSGLSRKQRSSSTPITLNYKITEESPRGTVVGDVLTDLTKSPTLKEAHSTNVRLKIDLTITNWRDRAVQLFALDVSTGVMRVIAPPDRESVCAPSDTMSSGTGTDMGSLEPLVIEDYGRADAVFIYGPVAPDVPCTVDVKVAYRIQYIHLNISAPNEHSSVVGTDTDPGLMTVRIEVVDINDHAPMFPQSRLMTELSELSSQPERTAIDLPTAFDPDAGRNGTVRYWLSDSNTMPTDRSSNYDRTKNPTLSQHLKHSLPFRLVSNPFRLMLTSSLDWETAREYSLIVFAQDHGIPTARIGQLNIHIVVRDENDNVPKFSQSDYFVVINESVLRGSVILELTSKDADSSSNGQVSHLIVS
ncbi:hypothetical protein EG68_01592 [Paragonimus skrjabini miyazakii]|uniref:Cadherin domain-containing protein n=1 Tax=Paragonimus skrjabini miyazakii TaxID=59628 RepID=A0A8S9ZBE4_9TREM|nr:hypothetical protein EG68_01592 [Paragonimus skrjabini miyazakii]